MNTDRIIFTSAILTLGSTTARSMLPKNIGGLGEAPSPKLLIGTSLAFLGLSILGDIAPEFAGPLAISVAFTATTYYGLPILESYFGKDK